MVPGELFPTLHWMTWRMDAWNLRFMQSCKHAIIYSHYSTIPVVSAANLSSNYLNSTVLGGTPPASCWRILILVSFFPQP
jgi:hypothetical protein